MSKRSRSIGLHYEQLNGVVPFEEDVKLKTILLEESMQENSWKGYVTKWHEIKKHTGNKVKINTIIPARRMFFNMMGLEAGTYVFSGEDAMRRMNIMPRQHLIEGAYKRFILPEGSSGEKAYMGSGGFSTIEKGVIPIGAWTTYTEEKELFDTHETVHDIMRNYGEFAGMLIDSYFRDAIYYGAGFVFSLLKYENGFNSVYSPILEPLIRRITSRMKANGAKPVSQVLGSSCNYGTEPINTTFVMKIPAEAELEFIKNPKFIPLEKYSAILSRGPLENEIGKIGTVRVVTDDTLPIKEDKKNKRLYIEAIIMSQSPIDGIKIESRKGGGIDLIHMPVNQKDKSDKLNRFGVIGFKSFLGSIALHPERTAIIKMYLDIQSVEDMIEYSKKCEQFCTPNCTEGELTTEDACSVKK